MKRFYVVAFCGAFALTSARAQTSISSRTAIIAAPTPSATMSIAPISNPVIFNGAVVSVIAATVNVYTAHGRVYMMGQPVYSTVTLVTNNGPIPNGTYSIQFFFTYAAESPVITVTGYGDKLISQCNLTDQENWNTPERVCDSGMFEITDNRLAVTVKLASGNSAVLNRIVMNAYPAMKVR